MCVHEEHGCGWTGELGRLDEHLGVFKRLQGCAFKSLTCKHCHESFQRKQIESHELKCYRKEVTCDYCEWYSCEKQNLPQHWDEYELYPIVCPKGCGSIVTRIGLDEHVATNCPLAIVECKYAYAGCAVKMQRKNMKDHLEESLKDHLTMLEAKYFKLEMDYKKEQETNAKLIDDLDQATDEQEEERAKKYEEMKLLKELCEQREESEFEDASNAVVVGNIGFGTTEDMLKSVFGQYGRVRIVKLYNRGFQNPLAVVEYVNDDSIHSLFQKYEANGIRLRQCQLKCVHLGY